jgi:hypothetical protein
VVDHGRGDQMLVHGDRQRGRGTVVGQSADKGAHLAVARPSTAELLRHQRGKHLVRLQKPVVLGDEGAGLVAFGGAFGDARPQLLNQRLQLNRIAHRKILHRTPCSGHECEGERDRRQL